MLTGSVTFHGLPGLRFGFFGGGDPKGDCRYDRGSGQAFCTHEEARNAGRHAWSKCNDASNFASLCFFATYF